MKHYDLTIAEGSNVTNLVTPKGTAFPANEDPGELFFRTDLNELYVYSGTAWAVAGSPGSTIANTQITATASQTVFNVSYTVGNLLVHMNGAKLLDGIDYTATNGTTVVLTVGATVNDVLDFEGFTVSSVSDFYTKAQSDSNFVDVGGDTMTGTLVLNADPSGSLDAATKQYVDNYSVPVGGGTFTGPIGIGVTPEAGWPSTWDVLQIGDTRFSTIVENSTGNLIIGTNYYNDGTYKYKITSQAARYYQSVVGTHVFQTAVSGTADAAITWNTSLFLDNASDAYFSGDVNLLNTQNISFEDSGGTNKDVLTYWSDDKVYLDGGVNGTVFRVNGALTTAMVIDSAGDVRFNNNQVNVDEDINITSTTVPTWTAGWNTLKLGGNASLMAHDDLGASNAHYIQQNVYYNAGWKRISTDEAAQIRIGDGAIALKTAASGAAGSIISWVTGLQVDVNSIVTMPKQPAFQAIPTSIQSNIPITSWTTIILGTERFDVGANFSANTFTAPITGKYNLHARIRLDNADSGAAFYQARIQTSNKSYFFIVDTNRVTTNDYTYLNFVISAIADMDANDTAILSIYQSGGTAQADIQTGTYFSGILAA